MSHKHVFRFYPSHAESIEHCRRINELAGKEIMRPLLPTHRLCKVCGAVELNKH